MKVSIVIQIVFLINFCMSEEKSFSLLEEKKHIVIGSGNVSSIPIVLWHGTGDYSSNTFMNTMVQFLKKYIPGVYIVSMNIGRNIVDDFASNYFGDVNNHISYACRMLAENSNLRFGYNAIGFSQGAQFMRAVAQRCPRPMMINLISLGGQHQGVYGVPHCSAHVNKFCDHIRTVISLVAYIPWVQNFLVPAQFWHDPINEDTYIQHSMFLANINNEKEKNLTYKNNLLKLKNFVLVKFINDTIVSPIETEWFGFYKSGQKKDVYTLEDSKLYKEDWLGLKKLNLQGKLHFLSMAGEHMQINWRWFRENIIENFLVES